MTHGGGRGWLTLPPPCFDKQDALVLFGRALVQSTDGDPEFTHSWLLFLCLELDSSAPLAWGDCPRDAGLPISAFNTLQRSRTKHWLVSAKR